MFSNQFFEIKFKENKWILNFVEICQNMSVKATVAIHGIYLLPFLWYDYNMFTISNLNTFTNGVTRQFYANEIDK